MLKEKEIETMKILIKNNNAAKFGLDEDYEIYNSILVEDYLANQYKDDKSDADCKKMIFKFASKYMHKDLYITEGVKDNIFYILIEDEGDEILDRLEIGKCKSEETLDDFEVISYKMRIEDHLRLCAILDDTPDPKRLEEFKLLGRYLGLEDTYYICAVKDNYENTLRLVTNSNREVIQKIH